VKDKMLLLDNITGKPMGEIKICDNCGNFKTFDFIKKKEICPICPEEENDLRLDKVLRATKIDYWRSGIWLYYSIPNR
jgi:hypothetical protein